MNDATLLDLDDVERQLVRALRAKADQVLVEDEPFDPAAAGPTLDVIPLVPRRRSRRRVLVAAAAVVVAAGLGAAAVSVARQARVPGSPTIALAAGPRYSVPEHGPAGFVPTALPAGWALREMHVGATTVPDPDARWQLFAAGGSPEAGGVIVGSVRNEGTARREIRATGHTVRGRPAEIRPAPDPTAPPGAVAATWIDDGVVHDALAVGVDETELVALLDGLVARDDPAAGFDAPAGAALAEVGHATVGDYTTTSVVYADPAGGSVTVVASSSDLYGGLLQRLAGVLGPDGYVRHGTTGGDPTDAFVSVARSDGWTVDVAARDSATVAQDPAVLDRILASVAPATTQQLVDIGVAQPVTASYTADGWTVELHGTAAEAVAMCLTADSGTRVCTTAEDAAPWSLVAGSALVDGRWVVATVSERRAATIQTTVLDPTATPDPEDLAWAGRNRDRRPGEPIVQLVTVPAAAEAVEVRVPTIGDQEVGFVYERPNA
jgi:hypothetical protein